MIPTRTGHAPKYEIQTSAFRKKREFLSFNQSSKVVSSRLELVMCKGDKNSRDMHNIALFLPEIRHLLSAVEGASSSVSKCASVLKSDSNDYFRAQMGQSSPGAPLKRSIEAQIFSQDSGIAERMEDYQDSTQNVKRDTKMLPVEVPYHHTARARSMRRKKSSKKSFPVSGSVTDKGHKRSHVHHNYHDFSNCCTQDNPILPVFEDRRMGKGGIASPFPIVLHQMLEDADNQSYSDIVSWQTHGRAFHVHDQERFVKEVMPRFFRQTRFSSFQRQLSLYGFLRLTRKGPDHGAYYHELCLRGVPQLSARIQRTRIKGYGVRPASDPDSEPDFINMPKVGQDTEQMRGGHSAVVTIPSRVSSSNSSAGHSSSSMPALSASMPLDHMALVQSMTSYQLQQVSNSMQPISAPPSLAYANATSAGRHDNTGADDERESMNVAQYHHETSLTLSSSYGEVYNHLDEQKPTAQGSLQLKSQQQNIFDILPNEQDDLVAFLSDVELSEDEGEDQVYRNEDELGRIFATKRGGLFHNTVTGPYSGEYFVF